jgi:hypothetical protein
MALTGTFTATGQSAAQDIAKGSFNVSLWGTFVGTVQIERSFNGTTWLPCTNLGAAVTFTAPMTEVLNEPEQYVTYRLNCTAYTSGTINYRISQ